MKGEDRRAEIRIPKVGVVRYSDAHGPGGEPVRFLNLAFSEDISGAGICLRSLKPIHGKISIRLADSQSWGPPRTGVVRWCTEDLPGIYRAGVSLI